MTTTLTAAEMVKLEDMVRERVKLQVADNADRLLAAGHTLEAAEEYLVERTVRVMLAEAGLRAA